MKELTLHSGMALKLYSHLMNFGYTRSLYISLVWYGGVQSTQNSIICFMAIIHSENPKTILIVEYKSNTNSLLDAIV